eukprot:gene22370-28492_t
MTLLVFVNVFLVIRVPIVPNECVLQQKLLCPYALTTAAVQAYAGTKAICSGNGRCLSLREVNQYGDSVSFGAGVLYANWDADMIFGCVCDEGYEGPACERRSCPKGEDPLVLNPYDEIQLLDCECSSCTGGVYLSYLGEQTELIPFDATEQLIAYRLGQLSTVRAVDVQFRHGTAMCSTDGSISEITFRAFSPVKAPILLFAAGGLSGSHVDVQWRGARSSIDSDVGSGLGTREYVECSNRGVCNYISGVCNCYEGFSSSDGVSGQVGTVGDCAYREFATHNFTYSNSSTTVTTSCPFEHNAVCSGNGTCNEALGVCTCFSGYVGSACANISCATDFTWFGRVDSKHSGVSVCGGVGTCDGNTGLCTDCGGSANLYTGDSCEYLSCAGEGTADLCSGNGVCLTMRELARMAYDDKKQLSGVAYSDEWDADHIRGCACTRAISVDGQYDPLYYKLVDEHYFNRTSNASASFDAEDLSKFYRGPYAFAATDFKGYNCGNALCPKGDNAKSRGVNEIQEFHCLADNGTFQLTFRENTTLPISYNATALELQQSLEQIYTISQVSVTTSGNYLRNHSVCNVFDNITIYIEFLGEFGDLPLLQTDVRGIQNVGFGLSLYSGNFVMNITEYQKGTKFDLECSAQGLCDEDVGVCSCFEGFGSSNGTLVAPGERGDCSFYNPLYTQLRLKK